MNVLEWLVIIGFTAFILVMIETVDLFLFSKYDLVLTDLIVMVHKKVKVEGWVILILLSLFSIYFYLF